MNEVWIPASDLTYPENFHIHIPTVLSCSFSELLDEGDVVLTPLAAMKCRLVREGDESKPLWAFALGF